MMGEVIRVSGRAPDVGEFLREAMLSQRFADVALCCPGGQRFLAHRLVLSAASPYLQEVLLAHSKAAGHCEPITVILAEVEAPELAAILGFVYTGSATVPRPRLEAFLRAAEALHIRLPPVPVVMTCTEADCKQEDVKDVKINPRYLQCEQYPSCDKWYRSRLVHPEDPTSKKELYSPNSFVEHLEASRVVEHQNEPSNIVRQRYVPSKTQCTTTWPVSSFERVEHEKSTQQRMDQYTEKRTVPLDVRRFHPASVTVRMDRQNETEKSMEAGTTSACEGTMKVYQQDVCVARGHAEVHGRLDPLEMRLRGDYGRLQASYGVGKLPLEEEGQERGSLGKETSMEVENTRDNRVGVIRMREGAFAGRNAGMQIGRSYEREYGSGGEDLSCAENCCRWRTPRRHVANRVTASPWRQISRPHHSPKVQPMMLHAVEETEVVDNVHVPEVPCPPASSLSPTHHSPKSHVTNDNFYGFEVPTACESTFSSTVRPLDTETRLQEFYPPQIPFPPTQQTSPTIQSSTSNLPPTETFFQPPSNVSNTRLVPEAPVSTRILTNNNESPQLPTAGKKSGYFGQSQPQKPELSHPVSRLCDTIESTEKKESFVGLEMKMVEEKIEVEEKIVGRTFVNSDSNNNDAIVGNEVGQRTRSSGGQEDHKCDQCGKTFVTRASLKVHTRTHSGEKPFRCADCGKQFSQLRNYKYHRSVHEGTREFAATCPECGKYFNDRGYLSSHMKIHRNRKEYACAECGKSFNQRVAYNMHVRIHTGVKPHQCEQCGKAFSRKMLLKQHLRTHSGERPYQCQVCQKAFADRSNMTLHTRLHSGLKPYQCTLCSKAFTKKHHLKTHLNYHTGTKPYSCPNCGLRFSQSSNMRTHYKKCAVNNPGGMKNSNDGGIGETKKGVEVQVISRTTSDALTPPNSDQESSILTPISKTAALENSVT